MADIGKGPTKQVKKSAKIPGAAKIRNKELPTFTRQLSAMLSSGMPVVQSLNGMEEQTSNPVFSKVIAGVRGQIEGGYSFSEALPKYPSVFDELYVSMLRAGESGGLLAETTGRIANYLEASARLKRRVKGAMMYPTIVSVVAILLAVSMIIWIVPVFGSIYADFGANLPGPTAVLVKLSDALRSKLIYFILGFTAIGIAFNQFKKTEKGAYLVDMAKIKFPLLGELALKVAVARFASTFAQLMRSGVPILQALDIVSFAIGNKVLAKTLQEAKANVERGEPLSSALQKEKNYPRMLVHMLSAGEQMGKVEDMLAKDCRLL